MVPIESLLHRIRWDAEFGRAEFTIGYYDRVGRVVVSLPIERIHVDPARHFSFTAVEPDGSLHDVPFHRVREVYRNGELIWQRAVAGELRPATRRKHPPSDEQHDR